MKTEKNIEQNIINLYNIGYGTNFLSKKFDKHRSTIQTILKKK